MQELKDNPPDFLSSDSQLSYYGQLIDRLDENGVALKTQDIFSLGTLALNLALLDECSASIAEHGMIMHVRGDRGMITKTNPAVVMQKEAQTAIRFYFKEFQMSPSSRGNGGLHVPNPHSKGDGELGLSDL